jgi:hypothetical protein
MSLIDQLRAEIAANPNAIADLRALLDALDPSKSQPRSSGTTCPALGTMTFMQATMFNNGEKEERRRNTAQFKVSLEVYTTDPIKVSQPCWSRAISLIENWTFKTRIDQRLEQGKMDATEHARIAHVWEVFQPRANSGIELYMGLIGDKGTAENKGTNYYPGQFIAAQITGKLPRRPLTFAIATGDEFTFFGEEDFDTSDMKGQPLRGNAKAQIRADFGNRFPTSWQTTSPEISQF